MPAEPNDEAIVVARHEHFRLTTEFSSNEGVAISAPQGDASITVSSAMEVASGIESRVGGNLVRVLTHYLNASGSEDVPRAIAVKLGGVGDRLINEGNILSDWFSVVASAPGFEILNNGYISGYVTFQGHSAHGRLINNGTLIGPVTAIDGGCDIRNYGYLSSGRIEPDADSGFARIAIQSFGDDPTRLLNEGHVDGHVRLFAGSVVNIGIISGNVHVDGSFTGTGGTVEGNVTVEGRIDLRAADITGDVSGSESADRIDLRDAEIGGMVSGGRGNDTYIVDSSSIEIDEQAGGGRDRVLAYADHTLAANIEDLYLRPGATFGTGNDISNRIYGNRRDNVLDGGHSADRLFGDEGDDLLIDGHGVDRLWGGEGADVFALTADGDVDIIYDFELGSDRLDLSAWDVFDLGDVALRTHRPGYVVLTCDDEVLAVRDAVGELTAEDFTPEQFIFAV